MSNYSFSKGTELIELCRSNSCTIGELMLMRESSENELGHDGIILQMAKNLEVMKTSITEGLEEFNRSVSGITGGDSEKLFAYCDSGASIIGEKAGKAIASAMAVVEVNASMGKIVAAPTAGASGILPGVLISCGKDRGWTDDDLINGLFCAGAIGMLIAQNASISGAEGGCQAETGSAAAMAAAALCELSGGSPEKCLDAAAMALKNVMGLICDPVAGLVECPCIKRNAIGAANAMICADMALAGIGSIIPFDDAVSAMKSVGRLMSPDLKETARGGIAITPTGKRIAQSLEE